MEVIVNLNPGNVEIGKLEYGTLITGITTHPKCVYIKVNKRHLGSGVELDTDKDMSVLLNVKTGGLRAVHGSTKVIVLDAELHADTAMNPLVYLKEMYKSC